MLIYCVILFFCASANFPPAPPPFLTASTCPLVQGETIFHTRYLFVHTRNFHATCLPAFASNRGEETNRAEPVYGSIFAHFRTPPVSACLDARHGLRVDLPCGRLAAGNFPAPESHPPGISPDHHRDFRVRVCRRSLGPFSGYPGPHLPDSWFRVLACRRHAHRLEHPFFSAYPRESDLVPLGPRRLVDQPAAPRPALRHGPGRRALYSPLAPSKAGNCRRLVCRSRGHVYHYRLVAEASAGRFSSPGRLHPQSAATVARGHLSDCSVWLPEAQISAEFRL